MLWDAFDKGFIAGVMCNSDGHKGRPGAEGPGAGQFGIANGLTCVLAEAKTRKAIWEALKSRRCYGTTGARIDLKFEVDGKPMGSVIETAAPDACLFAEVCGTGPIESLEVFEGKKVIHTVRPKAFSEVEKSRRLRVSWRGSRIRGRGRRVNWAGFISVEGAKIVSATSNFDTPVDRITSTTDSRVDFISQTTGDTDSIDLVLDRADRGTLIFESKAGKARVDLSELTEKKKFPFGGLDIELAIERYPEELTETTARVEMTLNPAAGKTTPYFVKVTQVDGQMAWASPIYLMRG